MTAALVSPALPTLANTDRSRAAVRAVLAAMAMVVTDAAMMNVALPTFADAFGVSAARSVQVVSVYQIAVVMFLLPCAAVGEAIGLRKVFCCGLATFVAASTLAASAGSFQWLVAARFAQGVGAAAVMALGIALLRQALPEATLTKAIGWNAVTVALCSAAGPTAAAIVLTLADWPTLFMVHLPFAALALANSRALPAPRRADTAPDLLGIGIGATAFGALFVGLSAFATGPALASMLVAGSAICFWLEARRARNRQLPVIRVDLLKLRSFRRSIVASVCCFVAQTAGLLAVPFYLHDALALSPLWIGIYMTPWPAAVATAAIASARVLARRPDLPVAPLGGALLAAGLVSAATAAAFYPSAWCMTAATAVCGGGFGLFQVANNQRLFLGAPVERSAAAGGLQGTARLSGQAIGAIAISWLLAQSSPAEAAIVALAVASLLALASAAASLRPSSKSDLSAINWSRPQ